MMNTIAKTRLGNQIPVLLFMKSLQPKDGILDADENDAEKPAFVVIARNTQENAYTAFEKKEFTSQFDEQWRNHEFRQEFLRFAKKENNEENVKFLMDVLRYRWSPIELRVDMQKEIFNRYFGDVSLELNVSATLIRNLEFKMARGIGDIDVFDEIEDAVREMIKTDIYPRFLARNK
jgi:hypothetical protein